MPNPSEQRAQEIVSEARRRLAEQNGKPSMLPQMIQRVQNEYEMQDAAPINHRNVIEGNAPQLPTGDGMQGYIDKVLQMSGMLDKSEFPATPTPENPPTPTPRPDQSNPATGMDDPYAGGGIDESLWTEDDDGEADKIIEDAANSGVSLGELMLGAAGVMGVTAAARAIYKAYERAKSDKAAAEAGDKTSRVKSAVDQSIDKTMGVTPNERIANATQDTSLLAADGSPKVQAPAQSSEAVIESALKMPVHQGIKHLSENGIDLTPELFNTVLFNPARSAPKGAAQNRAAKAAARHALP